MISVGAVTVIVPDGAGEFGAGEIGATGMGGPSGNGVRMGVVISVVGGAVGTVAVVSTGVLNSDTAADGSSTRYRRGSSTGLDSSATREAEITMR